MDGNENLKKGVVVIMKLLLYSLMVLLFAVSISLIVVFQRHIGALYAGIMLLGIAGLLFLLWIYNRKYR